MCARTNRCCNERGSSNQLRSFLHIPLYPVLGAIIRLQIKLFLFTCIVDIKRGVRATEIIYGMSVLRPILFLYFVLCGSRNLACPSVALVLHDYLIAWSSAIRQTLTVAWPLISRSKSNPISRAYHLFCSVPHESILLLTMPFL
jgi:hypothetical protein